MEHLLKVLGFTLSSDKTLRISAELELISISTQNGTGENLARIVTERSLDVHLRQITCFVLKKYVKERWSPFFPTFKGAPATSVEEKIIIRQLIFSSLADPERKIRLACAAIISDIAHPDWPDDWPTLSTELLSLIHQGRTQEEVEGGMRVLNEFVGVDLTEDQFLPLAREMLPRLLEILMDKETHSPSTRARTVLIFKQCVMTLFTVKDEHPAAVKSAISEILPQWLQAFVYLLQVDVTLEVSGEDWDGLSIRIAIFNTLEIILNSFPTSLNPHLSTFLTSSLSHLSQLYPTYSNYYLSNSSNDSLPPTSTEEDSDITSDLPGLVATILDFLSQISRRKNAKAFFTSALDQSLEIGILFAGMTTDDEETWASDPNAFVADEDDEMVSFNVRLASIDFVIALVDTFETSALKSLWIAFQTQAARAEQSKINQDEDWWKVYESALAIVGAVSTELLVHVQESSASESSPVFDLSLLFSSIVPTYLASSDLPFLQGRSFVFASQFAQALPTELANSYIDAAIQVLESSSAGVPVKVSAVRALNNFFRHLKGSIDIGRATTTLGQLLPLLPQTTENTLTLIVDTLQSTLKVGGNALDSSLCTLLVNTILSTWFEKPQDPVLGASICELFEALSAIPTESVQQNILKETLPSLSTIMTEIEHDPFSPRAAAAVEIIEAIFRGSVSLSDGMFNSIAEVLFKVLATTEDREIQQTGLHIITLVVRKDVNQLLNWRSAQGQSGLELVLAQVARLLDPSGSESGGLFVGDLVIHLIRKAGSALGPVLPDLLAAFVNRLATAQTASFSQSLILPFAYLLHNQSDTVLSLLEGIEVPANGSTPARSALEVLLSTWCENVEVFQGYWNIKVSTVALSQLYMSQRSSVQQINVKGDLLLTAANSNSIMTRARAKNNPDQFPPIPFFAKAIKILLHDVQNSGDDATFGKAGIDDAESDDGDDDWADDGAEFRSGDDDLDLLSDMLNGGGSLAKYLNEDDSDDGGEDQEGEEDLKDDPIYVLDLQSHLVGFFRQAYEADTNSFRQLVENFLTSSEREVLAQVLQA